MDDASIFGQSLIRVFTRRIHAKKLPFIPVFLELSISNPFSVIIFLFLPFVPHSYLLDVYLGET